MAASQLFSPVLETRHKPSVTWNPCTTIEEVSQVNAELELGSFEKDMLVGVRAEGPESGPVLTSCPWLTPSMTHRAPTLKTVCL